MPALILFIKNPIPGQTKTRLAAEVGNEMALKMYHVLTDWTRQQALGLANAERYLYYSSEITVGDKWPETDFHKRLQHGPGLGERMENAFAEVFAAGHHRAIIIGSDCPGITTAYLETAFAALQDHDLVIGPALDGGYTLLGLRQPAPELFKNMAWSTTEVLPTTLARAAAAGLSVKQLPPLSDVDYLADWQHYGWPMPE
ncbi:TIGR04282 family arsenosugar biosynthesis glycosyltransferase [Neolewinella lacunae]|uniref:TIGR04282 family arsenosugar biosynthesis glycosyltransferase n=1 Tax=Neolewinella lacunae TaxID=1517758 RepID=A0A923TEI5_9BACT|nr:TIGR04282 family arsenosugar biosynthesis glycosyltransferase [Neolewinella lacunae]MBC6995952.1 TIGR04282 family arsenosugar biosynthesis glycosyltransferase [Neolewinella lacunae]MDN3635204.1 TIGR04282 family arsenosugar biosynthesis glycosyltransferase [Neolewinella lacunae]